MVWQGFIRSGVAGFGRVKPGGARQGFIDMGWQGLLGRVKARQGIDKVRLGGLRYGGSWYGKEL